MIRLTKTLQTWGTPEFTFMLKSEIESLALEQLPLQQALTVSSVVFESKPTALILKITDDEHFIHAKIGIMYEGIVPGCSCADDPTPMSENPEYCELQLDIDKHTAETVVMLLSE